MREQLYNLWNHIPNLLASITIDDYIAFDKWTLALQCMNGTVESCLRGLGL